MQSFGVKSGTEQPSLLLYGGWPRRFLSASVCSSLFSACSFFKNQKCDLCRPSRRGQLAAQRGATRRAPWAAHFLFENAFFTATFSLRKYFSKFVTFLRARSRLYRNRFLRVNVHIAAFFKLFKICILPAAGLCPLPPLPGRCWPDTIEGKNTTLFSFFSYFFFLPSSTQMRIPGSPKTCLLKSLETFWKYEMSFRIAHKLICPNATTWSTIYDGQLVQDRALYHGLQTRTYQEIHKLSKHESRRREMFAKKRVPNDIISSELFG